MHAFIGLSSMQQATLSAVAPGIAEALIATAIGLFAAIPAVLAYNRYTNEIDRLRSEAHTSELQSLMRISYAVLCWTKKIVTAHVITPLPHTKKVLHHLNL